MTLRRHPDRQPSLADLRASVGGLEVPAGLVNALKAKLVSAQRSLDELDTDGACLELTAFANQVRAQSGKKISTSEAEALLARVATFRKSLGCG
jgi:hypothetical protein